MDGGMTAEPSAADGPVVDVLVATRDRHEDLARMLGTAVGQTHERFRLVVLDQSDDVEPNRRAVAALSDRRIEHVSDGRRGKSRALNLGLGLTDSPYVAFTDDDCELPPEWLERLLDALASRPTAGLAFGTLAPAAHEPDTHFIPSIAFSSRRVLCGPPDRAYGLIGMGANMIVRRAALDVTGLFDEDLGPGGVLHTGEECELGYRMLRSGFDVVQDPAPVVIHHGARTRAGGVASDLVNTGFFAIGGGYGKHVRRGDARALLVVVLELKVAVGAMLAALAARRPPYHLRRLRRFCAGVVAGLVRGPAWPAAVTRRTEGAKP